MRFIFLMFRSGPEIIGLVRKIWGVIMIFTATQQHSRGAPHGVSVPVSLASITAWGSLGGWLELQLTSFTDENVPDSVTQKVSTE